MFEINKKMINPNLHSAIQNIVHYIHKNIHHALHLHIVHYCDMDCKNMGSILKIKDNAFLKIIDIMFLRDL